MTKEQADNFDRVLKIQEESIKASTELTSNIDKFIHEITDFHKKIEGFFDKWEKKQDTKEIEIKAERAENEKVIFWLKFFGSLITMFTLVIGAISLFIKR